MSDKTSMVKNVATALSSMGMKKAISFILPSLSTVALSVTLLVLVALYPQKGWDFISGEERIVQNESPSPLPSPGENNISTPDTLTPSQPPITGTVETYSESPTEEIDSTTQEIPETSYSSPSNTQQEGTQTSEDYIQQHPHNQSPLYPQQPIPAPQSPEITTSPPDDNLPQENESIGNQKEEMTVETTKENY